MARSLPELWSQAFLAAYLGDFDRARAIVAEGLARHPNESGLFLVKGGIGVLTGDPAAMEEASRQALAVDPDDPFALGLRSEVQLHYKGNPDAAIAASRRAAALAPAGGDYWNQLAQGLIERGYEREAERAIYQGLREDPASLVLRTNHAIILLTEQGRLAEAKAQLNAATRLDPDNAAVNHVRSLYELMRGNDAAALDSALAASAANPSYGEVLIMLAAIYYQQRDYAAAFQQLDAAERADPASPYIPIVRAAFAIDQYRADDAIVAARDALRRYQARGGVYANLGESQGTGSFITSAFRFLNLEDWGRYVADRTFDPFEATSLFDRAISQSPSPYFAGSSIIPFDAQAGNGDAALSDIFQGLRLDPLAVAGPEAELQLFRQTFAEGVLAPGLVAANGDVGPLLEGQFSATTYAPFPISITATGARSRRNGAFGTNHDLDSDSYTLFAGLQPAPFHNLVLFTNWSSNRTEFPGTTIFPRDNGDTENDTFLSLLFYAHELGRESVLTAGGGMLLTNQSLRRRDIVPLAGSPLLFDVRYSEELESDSWLGYLNYAGGFGPVEVNVGLDYLTNDTPQVKRITISNPAIGSQSSVERERAETEQYRAYLDVRFAPSNAIELQGQIAQARSRTNDEGEARTDWSIGAAWAPIDGQWLRAGYADRSALDLPVTLAPTAIAGLRPAEAPAFGSTESLIGRWDAEWSPHFFTAVEYQRQQFDGLSFNQPNFVRPILDLLSPDTPGLASIVVGRADLERLSVSANLWLRGNIGINATYAYSDTEVETGDFVGGAIPFVSRHFARAGITWTHPSLVRLRGFATYNGPRRNSVEGDRDQQLALNAELEWESPDRRFQLNAGFYNILDDQAELIPGVPSFGRAATATLRLRF